MWKALNRLNETQRTLIVAHYIHNQTYDYISKKYGIEKKQSPPYYQTGTECVAMSTRIEKKVLPHRALALCGSFYAIVLSRGSNIYSMYSSFYGMIKRNIYNANEDK